MVKLDDNAVFTPKQKTNILAQKKNARMMKVLMNKIKQDVIKAGNSNNPKQALEFFTTVNVFKSRRYEADVKEIVNSIDDSYRKILHVK